MLEFNARKFPTAAIKAAQIALPRKPLSPAAQQVAAQPTVPAYSPIVLASIEPATMPVSADYPMELGGARASVEFTNAR